MTLFIGNISYNITEKDIAELFGKYGKCKNDNSISYS